MRTGIALALLAVACAGGEATPATNVVLVTVDTLRPDRLSCYGFTGHETRNFDRVAREGVLFENAWTDTPWTTPSMATVLTGTYPTLHGFRSTNVHRLGDDNQTLAEILREAGFATAAVVGSFPLDAIYRLDQGFAHYDDAFTTPIWIHPEVEAGHLESEFREVPEDQAMFAMAKAMNDSRRTDAEVSDAAIAWLADADDGPFFLWVHYFGPHSKPDWRVPEAERMRRQRAAYEPDVLETDRQLGRLLDALDRQGRTAETLLVVHADHGESLGEQGYFGHGSLLNEATMRIPLMLRWPGRIEAGTRERNPARNVDILPTVLAALQLPLPERHSGRDLLAPAGNEPAPVYMETWYPAHGAFATPVALAGGGHVRVGVVRRAVVSGRWKLVRSEPHPMLDDSDEAFRDIPAAALAAVRSEALYDLRSPGGERRDLRQRHPEVVSRLGAILDARVAEERGGVGADPLPVDPDTRLRLESLGYGD